ncbi:hypothetical protein ASJ33_07265 [Dehalococcoides mccartyi]|jgi:gamma-glutamylcyclotransferase (GGCT)/AIG2-like uncharacterized protein YtfP|uniref:Gamma-glutamylcyclotransferase AIG2-like domain-containing protein n=1 Tax=Dehalococcoides mccartyi (strain VS) TaxID=311424 RepID=D2BJ38_DEHMV|nr:MULTISPECIES: gamma-glutamylcyclotransferase family protein [Dehalococcoides]ACZ62338.1 hypothetical protein DhcVS_1231 [Dehalococcoides mccartyi VS]AII58396.1 hypothetical protein X792_06815 [Dehalococcoides mccartyi CG1]APH12967.1 hypothetical protein ASJ33_07265 [Dehalococcoides mccartyi]QYY57624.1 gamma-glutamylcyclotransferase [Dehalococcoides mccartyi]BAQ35164.1 hypothetical protein UCH007_12060 [Dehalococcoides sp. UCH007]
MLYFAYGQTLSRKQMKEICPDAAPKQSAALANYKLVFLGYSRKWHGALASIKPSRGDRAKGGLYEISESGLRKLDAHEEFPANSERIKVNVHDDDGNMLEAFTHTRRRSDDEGKPSAEYLAVIQQAYHEWGLI